MPLKMKKTVQQMVDEASSEIERHRSSLIVSTLV